MLLYDMWETRRLSTARVDPSPQSIREDRRNDEMTRSQAGRLASACWLSTLVPVFAIGAAGEVKVGSRVIVRSRDTLLRVVDKAVTQGDTHFVFRVERAEGPWLWVIADCV